MKIAADDNIPLIDSACAELGEVTLFDARNAAEVRRLVRASDVLLCRSTIRVDEELLGSGPVRFVATATSGVEHVDARYLERRGIVLASAAGSNARSVAEYVFAALYRLGSRKDFDPARLSIGIVGVGHVGRAVKHIAQGLGMTVILNDPPRFDAGGDPAFRPLDDALRADIVTVHVPLVHVGPHPTTGMFDEATFARMNDGVIFLNTSRGGVLDEHALLRHAGRGKFRGLVLDVYRNEPSIDTALLPFADIATPHIAGHSHDGKLLGTQMVYDRLCAFLGVPAMWDHRAHLEGARIAVPEHSSSAGTPQTVDGVVRLAYDIEEDDAALRASASLSADTRGHRFASLRSTYRIRREFGATVLAGIPEHSPLATRLRAFGFAFEGAESNGRPEASNNQLQRGTN